MISMGRRTFLLRAGLVLAGGRSGAASVDEAALAQAVGVLAKEKSATECCRAGAVTLKSPRFSALAAQGSNERSGQITTVIIGRSLGSIVTYESLCAHPEWRVNTFVTLGSPWPHFRKAPAESDWRFRARPQRIGRWFNIGDKSDVIALGDRFGRRVTDHLIDNGTRGATLCGI
jgi:hypothetical protein